MRSWLKRAIRALGATCFPSGGQEHIFVFPSNDTRFVNTRAWKSFLGCRRFFNGVGLFRRGGIAPCIFLGRNMRARFAGFMARSRTHRTL